METIMPNVIKQPHPFYHPEDAKSAAAIYCPNNVITWPYRVIDIALDKYGNGPATVEDATSISFEVWTTFLDTVEVFDNLAPALDFAIELNERLAAHIQNGQKGEGLSEGRPKADESKVRVATPSSP